MAARFLLGGGIGSGKSTAARCLAARGAVVLDADRHGHEVLAPGTAENEEVARIWPRVLRRDGTIDRHALGRIVFADPAALATLEAITWPEIGLRLYREIARHPEAIVMIELPVLRDPIGAGWPWVVVDAPDERRVTRTVARSPHLSAGDVAQVMSRQPTRGEWLAAATWVIDNSGDEAHLARECARVWEQLELAPAS